MIHKIRRGTQVITIKTKTRDEAEVIANAYDAGQRHADDSKIIGVQWKPQGSLRRCPQCDELYLYDPDNPDKPCLDCEIASPSQ